ncbi:MAG: extracellular solute-binding protein [Gaiellaceae bacterium MAG52_C11]|nr:extracellular solute-binding protein [Candidatus Gaiellasilicea maunaloa]
MSAPRNSIRGHSLSPLRHRWWSYLAVLASASVAFAALVGVSAAAPAESTGSTRAAATSITFVDVAGGANFQQFFRQIIPQAERELGINISYVPSAAAELIQRLKGGQANQDVVLLKPDALISLLNANVGLVHLQSRRPKIPNLGMVARSDLTTVLGLPIYGQGVPFWRDQFGIIYDSAKIRNPPKTWADFHNRRAAWAGHIGIIRPDAASGGGRIMMRDYLLGNGVDERGSFAELQKTARWQQGLQKFKTFSDAFYKPAAGSPPELFQQFASGNVWITEYAIDFTLWSRDQGLLPKSVKAAFFPSATYGGAAYLSVPRNISGEQKLAAYKFVNWMLSLKTQRNMLTVMHQYPGITAWKKMPKTAFRDIPTWAAVQKFRTPLQNADAFNWLKQNGMQYIGN